MSRRKDLRVSLAAALRVDRVRVLRHENVRGVVLVNHADGSSASTLRLAQVAKEVSKPEVDTLLAAETGGDEFAAAQLCS
eukprot:53300-Rhodomonas_salina.1